MSNEVKEKEAFKDSFKESVKQGLANMVNPLYNIREFIGAENLNNFFKKIKLNDKASKVIGKFIGLDLESKDSEIIKKNWIVFVAMTGSLWTFQLIQTLFEPFHFIIDLKSLDLGAHLLLMGVSYSFYFIIKTKFAFAIKQEPEVKEEKEENEIISFAKVLLETKLNEKRNVILGYLEDGKLYLLDIKSIYHTIVASTTGYGKSNFAHVYISGLIKSDADISFFLFDPKKSELKRYRDIKRVFYTGDKDTIIKALKELVKEMDRRNDLIEQEKYVNNIETWNEKYPKNKMHYIVIYIEEIADLMLSSGKKYSEEFTYLISRLSQLGRSTGMRITLSTQYPRGDVLSPIIKINCVNRLGFAVTTSQESCLIIDSNILTTLKHKGEGYVRIGKDIVKIKVPYLENKDIENIVVYLEENHNESGKYDLSEKFVSFVSNEINSDVEPCHEENKNRVTTHLEKVEILTSEDLLKFYESNCENEVFSLTETLKYVNLGRTKIQELRSKLTSEGKLVQINNKLTLNKKVKLEKE